MPKPKTHGPVSGFMLELEVNVATFNGVPNPQLLGAPAGDPARINPGKDIVNRPSNHSSLTRSAASAAGFSMGGTH